VSLHGPRRPDDNFASIATERRSFKPHRNYLSPGVGTSLSASPPALVQETRGTPLATLLLQPGMIPSAATPPVMPGLTLPRRAPRWAGDLYWRLFDVAGGLIVGRHLNKVRATLGLGPVRRFFRWWYSSTSSITRPE
jgi:hypothetical protein